MIIGITGGTGCGKTTLLDLIREQGGMVLDCDAIYHELLKTDPELLSAIGTRFPGTVTGGELRRKKLGAIVFSDPAALADLNRISHGAVKRQVLKRLEEKPALAAIDAIALFEGGLAELCDVTVAVCAARESRIARLMVRDGITQEYAQSRINAQNSDEWFREKCSHTLENNGSFHAFRAECIAFLRELGIIEENSKGENHNDQ